jgi:type II secretory pathway pseudopilin PulG
MQRTPTRRGITYVEVLVVILILVAVISFLLPTFVAREEANPG